MYHSTQACIATNAFSSFQHLVCATKSTCNIMQVCSEPSQRSWFVWKYSMLWSGNSNLVSVHGRLQVWASWMDQEQIKKLWVSNLWQFSSRLSKWEERMRSCAPSFRKHCRQVPECYVASGMLSWHSAHCLNVSCRSLVVVPLYACDKQPLNHCQQAL